MAAVRPEQPRPDLSEHSTTQLPDTTLSPTAATAPTPVPSTAHSTAPRPPTQLDERPASSRVSESRTESSAAHSQSPLNHDQPAQSNGSTAPNLPPPASQPQRKNARFDWHAFKEYIDPSSHDVLRENNRIPPREYNSRTQKWRLWRLTWGEFFITFILCGCYAACLAGYASRSILSTTERRVFNALTTGLSAALGVNFSSSLRSYAKMLRWRMLAAKYRPLSQFDLILDTERQSSVVKLFFSDFHRKNKRFVIFSGTQLLCLLWLFVNLAAVVLVGLIGLTYNLENSGTFVQTFPGPTSIVDFAYYVPNSVTNPDLVALQRVAYENFFQNLPIDNLTFADFEDKYFSDTYEQSDTAPGFAQYFFVDYNPNNFYIDVISTRQISAQAYCTRHEVVSGQFGLSENITYVAANGTHQILRVFSVAEQEQPCGPGGLAISANAESDCGPRCNQMTVFQAAADETAFCSSLTEASLFICNNTLSQVQNLPGTDDDAAFEMTDYQALFYAGAMGWSGSNTNGTGRQFVTYANCDPLVLAWALQALTTDTAANLISGYAASVIATLDDRTSGARKVVQGLQPQYATVLVPTWWHAGPLLIVIPLIHLASLLVVIWFASRVIIKDDSYLAAAKLYAPLIGKLEDHGCILRGEQIVEALGDPSVVYGWREVGGGTRFEGDAMESERLAGEEGGGEEQRREAREDEMQALHHVDVFEQGAEGVHIGKKFAEGRYDGAGGGVVVRRRVKRE